MKTSVPLNPLTDLLGEKSGGEEENLLLLFKELLIADCGVLRGWAFIMLTFLGDIEKKLALTSARI